MGSSITLPIAKPKASVWKLDDVVDDDLIDEDDLLDDDDKKKPNDSSLKGKTYCYNEQQ